MVCRKWARGGSKSGGVRGMGQGGGVRGAIGVEYIFKSSFQSNNLNISILNFKDKSTVYSKSLCK